MTRQVVAEATPSITRGPWPARDGERERERDLADFWDDEQIKLSLALPHQVRP